MTLPDIRETDCLLIIDVQKDFCTGGSLAVPAAEEVLPWINENLAQFQTVVLTQDWHPAGHSSFASTHVDLAPFDTVEMPYGSQTLWPDHCIQGSNGAGFHDDLITDNAQLIIRKGFRNAIDSYSAFYENDHTTATGLTGYLRERSVQRLVCVGLALDYCVRFSAIDACREGFETVVVEAGCRGINVNGSNDDARLAMLAAGATLF
ncbi:MAG: nicotinamidase/pyrazinamidase [bacterium]|jgi:nicotinamidase/pyrazinamidase